MRKLDNKFHLEGEEIVKTSNGQAIPHDEPVFVLRASDYLALPLLEYYGQLCDQDGCTAYQMETLEQTKAGFRKFAEDHRERMKQPGVTKGL